MSADALSASVPLRRWLTQTLGARDVDIVSAVALSGGAIQENWALELAVDGAPRRVVARRDAPAAIASSRSRAEEHALLSAAWRAGIRVPEPLGFCADPAVIGGPFALVAHVEGVGYGPKVVRDASLGGDRTALGRELGRQLAMIHALRPDQSVAALLGPPPKNPATAEIAGVRAALDRLALRRLDLEWPLRWAERHAPPPGAVAFAHRDYRTGNYLVDAQGLTAILDWEFAGWSDPMADLGWFCAACWRFSRPDLEAGGVATRAAFYEGYAAEAGRAPDEARVRWWELMAHLRWAAIALEQGARDASGQEPSVHLALTGRIADELALAALRATAPPAATPSSVSETLQ